MPKYELAMAWYELILNRKKLYQHLKKLQDDVSGKALVFCSCKIGKARYWGRVTQEITDSKVSDQFSTSSSDARIQNLSNGIV